LGADHSNSLYRYRAHFIHQPPTCVFHCYRHEHPARSRLLSPPTNFGTYETSADLNAPCHEVGISSQWRDTTIANWLALWAGDYTYLNKTVAPDVQVYQDQFPTDNGSVPFPINNSSSLIGFVKAARDGFDKYRFKDDLHFGDDSLITLHWTLDAVFAGSSTA
jgi:hypothetical protein